MRTYGRRSIGAVGAMLALLAVTAVTGSLRVTHAITVRRDTTASAAAVWALWADVPGRVRWDPKLEHIALDRGFAPGSRGTVRVRGQGERAIEIVALEEGRAYTDRIALPAATYADWHHTITDHGDHRTVEFRIEASGPLSLVSAVVLHNALGAELPSVVDDLVALAEGH